MPLTNNRAIFKCKICEDLKYRSCKTKTGNSAVTPCECLMREAKVKLFGEKFEYATYENYKGRNASQSAAKKIMKAKPAGSFYIYGDVDLGKTHLLAAAYDQSYENGSWQKTFVAKETALLQAVKAENLMDKLRDYDTVIIDDISKIRLAAWDIEALFNFYDDIYRFEKRLLVSCNYPISTIAEYYGAAITRRIEERCEILNIQGAAYGIPENR